MKETQHFFRPLTFFERAFRPSFFDLFMTVIAVSFVALIIIGGIKSGNVTFVFCGLISAVGAYSLIKFLIFESTQTRLSLPRRTVIFGYKRALPVIKPIVITSDSQLKRGGVRELESPCFVQMHIWEKHQLTLTYFLSNTKIELSVLVSVTLADQPTAEQVERVLTLGPDGLRKILQREFSALLTRLDSYNRVSNCGFEQLRQELLTAVSKSDEVKAVGISVEIGSGSLSRTVSSSTGASSRDPFQETYPQTLLAH